jgi:tetratricopeptide (TPR) repeat protein
MLALRLQNYEEVGTPEYADNYADCLYGLVCYKFDINDIQSCEQYLSDYLAIRKHLAEASPYKQSILNYADSVKSAGLFKYKLKDYSKANNCYLEAIEIIEAHDCTKEWENHKTNMQSIHFLQGVLAIVEGDYGSAVKLLTSIADRNTESTLEHALDLSTVAYAKYKLGDLDAAKKDIAQVMTVLEEKQAYLDNNRDKVRCAAACVINNIITGENVEIREYNAQLDIRPLEKMIFDEIQLDKRCEI